MSVVPGAPFSRLCAKVTAWWVDSFSHALCVCPVKAVTEETGSPAQHPTLTYDQLRDDNRHRQGPGSPASMVQRRPAFDRPTTTTQPSAASSSDRSRSQNTLDSDVSARPRPFRPPSDPLGDISGVYCDPFRASVVDIMMRYYCLTSMC